MKSNNLPPSHPEELATRNLQQKHLIYDEVRALKIIETKKLNGVLLLNKPTGFTSNAVLQKVKRLFSAEKAGHTGSLDPLATGMLPICFGEATKFSQFQLDADKCYEVTGVLGIKTDTGDVTGKIIASTDNFEISKEQLINTINQFVGITKQTPSMYSALKHKGQPLYKYARAGIEIERQARDIHIKSIQLISYEANQFHLMVHSSKGTYIRNLVEDIGDVLGVYAHVSVLHRVFTAGFEHETMYELPLLENKTMVEREALLLPIDCMIQHLPQQTITASEANLLRTGRAVHYENKDLQGIVRLYDEANHFIGLGEADSSGQLKVKRLLSF